MQKKGYKLLGSGVDQTAFLEPGTGQVLKIFGTQHGTGTNKYTTDQKINIFWADFCHKHSNNPFLPKFAGWETFDYRGDKYLQIRMEQLTKLPPADSEALAELAGDNETYSKGKRGEADQARMKKARFDKLGNDTHRNWNGRDVQSAHNELVLLLGQHDYDLLLKTLNELYKISQSKGWVYDLHPGNFMRRNNGDPVIVDPWVVPGARRGGWW